MESKTLEPLGKDIICEFPEEVTTSSGIVLQNTEEVDSIEVKVLSVGNEVKNVNANDIILISKRNNSKFEFRGNKYYLVNESRIIGIIR